MEDHISKELKKKRNLADTSVKFYMDTLKNLNDKREIINLNFLKDPKAILDKISNYKLTTQRSIMIALVSILKSINSPLNAPYYKLLMEMNKQISDDASKNEKSITQDKNWMTWSEVIEKFNKMCDDIVIHKNISKQEYDDLLNVVILSLFVLVPPRRNKDYLNMKISVNGKGTDDKKFNWFNMKTKKFIFNNYKTDKTYGQQVVDVPKELYDILKIYVKHKKFGDGFLLVNFNDKSLKGSNSITYKLNDIFGKKVSSSMLRHIYLSDKFGEQLKQQKKLADQMGHSISQQKEYIKI